MLLITVQHEHWYSDNYNSRYNSTCVYINSADYTAECSDEHPMDEATATDNCGDVDIDVDETIIEGACAAEYMIVRTFTAGDDWESI